MDHRPSAAANRPVLSQESLGRDLFRIPSIPSFPQINFSALCLSSSMTLVSPVMTTGKPIRDVFIPQAWKVYWLCCSLSTSRAVAEDDMSFLQNNNPAAASIICRSRYHYLTNPPRKVEEQRRSFGWVLCTHLFYYKMRRQWS